MDFSSHSDNILCDSGSEKEETPLSQTEIELREVLSKVDTKSIIGACIAHSIHSGRPPFRKLIAELKDQLRDAPDSLEQVIGKKGIELLKAIR